MLGNLQAPANPGGWDSAFPSHLKGGVQETARITPKITCSPQKPHPQSPASSTHTVQPQYRRQQHLPSGSSSFPTTQPSPWMENPLKPPSGCRAAQLLGHELPFHADPIAASSSNDFQAYPLLQTPSSCSPTRAHPLPNPSPPSALSSPWLLLFSGRSQHHVSPRAQPEHLSAHPQPGSKLQTKRLCNRRTGEGQSPINILNPR